MEIELTLPDLGTDQSKKRDLNHVVLEGSIVLRAEIFSGDKNGTSSSGSSSGDGLFGADGRNSDLEIETSTQMRELRDRIRTIKGGLRKVARRTLRQAFDPSDFFVSGGTIVGWSSQNPNEIIYRRKVSVPGNHVIRVGYNGPRDGIFSPYSFHIVSIPPRLRFIRRMQGPTFTFLVYPEIELRATPSEIDFDEKSTLHWDVRFADSATVKPGVGHVAVAGGWSVSGSQDVSPNQETTYTLQATGPAGRRTDDAKVSINLPLIDSFYADDAAIKSGTGTVLHWKTTNADSVKLEANGKIVSVAADGQKKVSPSQTTTYRLLASGPGGGPVDKSLSIAVNHKPSAKIWAADTHILKGEFTSVHWQADHAHDVHISNLGSVSANGQQRVSPARTTDYRITAVGDNNWKAHDKVTVNVKQELRRTSTIGLSRYKTVKKGLRDPTFVHGYILRNVGSYLATHGVAGSQPKVTGVTNPSQFDYFIVAHRKIRNSTSIGSGASTNYFDGDPFPGTWEIRIKTDERHDAPPTLDLGVSWVYRP
jgi:hypothetical protein